MAVVIFLFFILGSIVYLIGYFSDKYSGSERWCDRCDSWNVMKLKGDLDGDYFICANCGNKNLKKRGCPHCGWYAKFENRFVHRVGPIWQYMDFGNSIMVYHETWNCPKHGDYMCVVDASRSRNYQNFKEREYESEAEEEEEYYY